MKFMPIFTEPEYCDLWSTCYPEHEINEEIKLVRNAKNRH